MKDFSELVRLAEAATPGPWKQHLVDDTTVICSHGDVCCTFANGGRDDDVDFDTDTERCEANAAFIAAANPQTILALTARVKELEEALRDVGRIWRRVEHVVNPPDKWGPWLEWGGESPTGPGFDSGFEVTVEVHRRDPRSDHFLISRARKLDWSHTGGGDDILYFREKDEGQEMLAALSGKGV